MKKLLAILSILLLLVGCSSDRKVYEEKVKRYETLWQSILNNDKFQTSSRNFDIEATLESGAYEIILDNPKSAMYDVEVVVVENNSDYNEEKMMPSAGIFDGTYSMIPNQIQTDKGYVGGMLLNGETDDATVNLKVLVSWRDQSRQQSFKEYFEFDFGAKEESAE